MIRYLQAAKSTVNAHIRNPLFENSYFLISSALVNALGGFLFWAFSARFYSTESVGIASVLISTLTLLTLFSSLGLGVSLIRYLPTAGREAGRIVDTSFSLGVIASSMTAIVFIAGIPIWSPVLSAQFGDPIYVVTFVVFSIASTSNYIISCVFLAKVSSKFTLFQNSVGVVARLVLVVVLLVVAKDVLGIYLAAGMSIALALLASHFAFLPRILEGNGVRFGLDRGVLRELGAYSAANYISRILLESAPLLLPLIAINMLGASMSAYFYIAWSISAMVLVIPTSVLNSFFALSAGNMQLLWQNALRSMKLIYSLLIPTVAIILVLGERLLTVFGTEYARNSTLVLQLLALSMIPYGVNYLLISVARVESNKGYLIWYAGSMTGATLVLSVILANSVGLAGIGWGCLLGQTCIAIPGTIHFFKRRRVRLMEQQRVCGLSPTGAGQP